MNRSYSSRHISLHSRIKNAFFYRSGGNRETVILKTRRKDFTWNYPEKSILRLTQRVRGAVYLSATLMGLCNSWIPSKPDTGTVHNRQILRGKSLNDATQFVALPLVNLGFRSAHASLSLSLMCYMT